MSREPLARREVLGGSIALASVLTASATVPVDAAEAGPIEAAYPEYVRLMRILDSACEVTWAAEELYQEPPRPSWHPATSEGGYEMVRASSGKMRCCLGMSPENLEELRALAEKPYVHEGDVSVRVGYALHHQRARQARASLNSIEAWQCEARRLADAAGLTAAREAEAFARAAANAHIDSMRAAKPDSLREAAFLALVVRELSDDVAIDNLLFQMAELVGLKPYWLTEATA